MNKLIISSLVFLLAACSPEASINSFTKAHVNVSSFDGTKEVYAQPMYVFANSGFHAAPITIGARWTEKVKDYVVVEVVIRDDYVNIDSLYFNIDGVFKQYKALLTLTQLTSPDRNTLAPRLSSRGFMVKLEDIEKLKNSKVAKIKVTTVSDGYLEGDLVKKDKFSPGAKSLINVFDQVVN